MIAIVAAESDIHTRRVGQELDRLRAPWLSVDLQQLPLLTVRSFEHRNSIRLGDREVDLAEVHVVWQRRPALPRHETMETEALQFCQSEWRQLVYSLFDEIEQVSDLAAQAGATKPRQLASARRVGLPIPETLITNDAEEAEAFLQRHHGDVVHKAMSAPRGRFLKTVVWNHTDLAELQRTLVLAPTIFQERVRGDDVRVTVVGDDVFAMRASNQARSDVDGRLDLDAHWKPVDVPSDTCRQLIALMRSLGLRFGTVDFIAQESEWTFLEVNPQGQFLYQEILTGQPLAATVAGYLAGFDRGD